MAHKTQLERVKAKLDRDGFVTRNECLSQFPAITRLGEFEVLPFNAPR
jgi:hypothetical protein